MDPDFMPRFSGLLYGSYGSLGYAWSPARYASHQRSFAVKRPLRKWVSSHRNDPKRSVKFAQRRRTR